MLNSLNKPYPFNDDFRHNLKIIISISFAVYLFLQFFQPFGTNTLESEKKTYLFLGGGFLVMIMLTINLLIIPFLIPKLFRTSFWKVKKEIAWNIWILFTISVAYFLYCRITGFFEIDIFFIFKTLLLSIIPVGILVMINQDRLLKINLKSALELNKKLSEYQHKSENEEEKKVIIKSDNGKEKVEINLNELQFIRSANNYIEIFWKNNDQIKKSLIRSSLLKAEESLKKYACIFRCHRTSIVNINNISEVSGNSQGYKLIFKNIEQTIPVSRNYYKELIELIK